jgi:hypothetical protein
MPAAGQRAVSEVVGTVLLFGFLVIAFSVYQGIVIPEQNQTAEFEHNLAVQKSVQELRNAVRRTASLGAEESVTLTLSASYPNRFLAVNPGGSVGVLQTESLGSITLRNATALDPEVAERPEDLVRADFLELLHFRRHPRHRCFRVKDRRKPLAIRWRGGGHQGLQQAASRHGIVPIESTQGPDRGQSGCLANRYAGAGGGIHSGQCQWGLLRECRFHPDAQQGVHRMVQAEAH